MRITFDTRLTILSFLDPPSTPLATAGGVSRLEFLDDGELFVPNGDVCTLFVILKYQKEALAGDCHAGGSGPHLGHCWCDGNRWAS